MAKPEIFVGFRGKEFKVKFSECSRRILAKMVRDSCMAPMRLAEGMRC